MTSQTLQFRRQGRTGRTAVVVLVIYAGLAAARVWLDAAPWLVALLVLPTLPAVWDLWRNPQAMLMLDSRQLRWSAGQYGGTLDFDAIDHIRFDTRWDLSVRASAVLRSGRKIHLPPQCLPPHRSFEAALLARGVAVERHHFRVF